MSEELPRDSLEEVFETAPCGFLVTGVDGTILRANDTLLDWIGYAREDLPGVRKFQDLLTLPGKIFYENQFFPLLRLQGSVRDVAFDLSRSDHEPLPVLVSSTVHHDSRGEPTLVVSAIFDATDRRAFERELQRAQRHAEQLAAVVTASSDAIVSMSPRGAIETWNHGAEQLFGYAAHDATAMCLVNILCVSADDEEWSDILDELRAGRPVQRDMVGRRADGNQVEVSAGFTPHWGPLGKLEAVSVIMRDIAHRRAAERMQQEFIAVATHELRSPVTSIKGNAQLMLRRGSYSERSVSAILAQADKLQRLIDDLMLASQIHADHFTIVPERIDLVAAVRMAVAYLGEDAAVQIDSPAGPLLINADPHRLNQVLTNLLTNALKYSPDNADILVRVTREGHEAHVAVIDHGVGISAEALPHLFDRFYRAKGTAGSVQGLGLGLYISRRIVDDHGGRIEVASKPGKGSTFTVVLPVALT